MKEIRTKRSNLVETNMQKVKGTQGANSGLDGKKEVRYMYEICFEEFLIYFTSK